MKIILYVYVNIVDHLFAFTFSPDAASLLQTADSSSKTPHSGLLRNTVKKLRTRIAQLGATSRMSCVSTAVPARQEY